MALRSSFADVTRQVGVLRVRARSLRLASAEDRPRAADLHLLDRWVEALDDLVGWIDAATDAAGRAEQAVDGGFDLARAVRALADCERCVARVSGHAIDEVLDCDRLNDLAQVVEKRQGEWHGWMLSVRQGMDALKRQLTVVPGALAAAWEEIGEYAATRLGIAKDLEGDGSSRGGEGERLVVES